MIARMPLVDLELTRLSRRWTTYGLRAFIAAGALAYIILYSSTLRTIGRSPQEMADFIGQMLNHIVGYFQWFVALAVAPILTAGAIAEERQQGTLSTLMLAEFRGRQIYFAKLGTALLHVELMLLSVLPLLAIASWFGGVDVPQVCRQFVVLTATATAICTLGLWYSTKASTSLESLFFTVLTVSLWLGATELIDRVQMTFLRTGFMTGVGIWTMRTMGGYPMTPLMWVPGVAIAICISLCALIATLRALPAAAVSQAAPRRRRQPSKPNWLLDRYLPVRPVGRLLVAGGEGLVVHTWRRRRRFLAAIGLIPLAFLPCAGSALIWALICYDVTSTIAAARRNGMLDGLMVAPEDGKAVAKAILQTFLRRSLLFLPAMAAELLPYLFMGSIIIQEPLFFFPQLAMPFLYMFTCVSVACMVSLWSASPVAQTCAAVFGILIYTTGSWAALQLATSLLWLGNLRLGFYGVSRPIFVLGLGIVAYYVFRRRLDRTWRNGAAR